jgi:hypothetical protein
MRNNVEISENVRKYEEVPKQPTWTTMAVFLLVSAAVVGILLFLR